MLEFTAGAEFLCNAKLRLFVKSKETFDNYRHKTALIIGNHSFQFDFIGYLLLADIFNALGSSKAVGKKALRTIPMFGWSFIFGESILLQRNWNKDCKNIGPQLDKLIKSEIPCQLFLFPEGTRFTKEKHQAGIVFAKENNIPYQYKYHLIPRVKGFVYTLRHYRNNCKYNDIVEH